MGRGEYSPSKPLFLILGYRSDSQTRLGMASVGSYACHIHQSSIEPTSIFSSSLHCPRTPSVCCKISSFFSFLLPGRSSTSSSTCLNSAFPSSTYTCAAPTLPCSPTTPLCIFLQCMQPCHQRYEQSLSGSFLCYSDLSQRKEQTPKRR